MRRGFTTHETIYNCIVWTGSFVIAWIDLDIDVFLAFGFLLIIDFLTGVGKAYRMDHSITSHKMKYGVISKFSLVLIPLTFAIAAKGLSVDASMLMTAGMNILIASEVYSIIGNYYAIKTGIELPEYDAVAALGRKIRNFLVKMDGDGKDV